MKVKDQLYLLKPGFYNSGLGPLYCGDSVPVEGMLSFCPSLRELVDVHYIDFAKPRAPLVDALGDTHQGAPVLILVDERVLSPASPEPLQANGRRFFNDERKIRHYLSVQYGLPSAG